MGKQRKKAKNRLAGPQPWEMAASTGGNDITRGYIDQLGVLTSQDGVLRDHGAGDLTTYEKILGDDQVAATFQQRRLAVISRPWTVVPGAEDKPSRMAADFLAETLHRIRWDNVTDKMLFGVFYGYAVAECLWGRDGRHITLDGVRVRKQRRFAFGADGSLRLLTMDDPLRGEEMPERKFWHFSTGADNDDEPYGLGLGHWLYWPTFFKRNGVRAWALFLDKFGAPTAKGVFPQAATQAEISRLMDALEAIQTNAGIALPAGMEVELLEATRSGRASYEGFIDRMNAAITKVVLSQTMTTDAAGGQYKGEVHKDVRNEVVRADADLVCTSFARQPGLWLTEWNFPGATRPRVWRDVEEPEDLHRRAERDRWIFDMGYRPTIEDVRETYGGEWEAVPASGPGNGQAKGGRAAFAEGAARDVADELFETLAAATLQEQAAGMLAPLLERLRQGLDPAEADAELAALYPRMDDHAFEVLLARMIFLADTLGRLEAEDDGRDD